MDSEIKHKSQDIRERLINLFKMIETERMDGIPVLNKQLSVDALGFDVFGDFYLGVLLTPWFMNLMLLPVEEEPPKLDGKIVGTKQSHALPGGRFEFIVGHEAEFGSFLSCSLFSPVFEFGDQETAMQTAQSVLDQVLTSPDPEAEPEEDEDADMREIWAGRLPVNNDQEEQLEAKLEAEPDVEQQVKKGPPPELSRRDVLRGFRKPREDAPSETTFAAKSPISEINVEGQS